MRSELAILMIGRSSSSQKSTDASSNGVAIGIQPCSLIRATSVRMSDFGQFRRLGLADVADIARTLEILMNETLDITKLEFDGRAHIVEFNDLSEVIDDLETAIKTPPMIVGKFENEKILKNPLHWMTPAETVGRTAPR